jgi:hypothetical protein
MMLRPGGYSLLIDPETGTIEQDTFTCAHCQKVTFLKALVRPDEQGGFCRKCMALVCAHCAGKPCNPIMKQVEEWEKIGNMILDGGGR